MPKSSATPSLRNAASRYNVLRITAAPCANGYRCVVVHVLIRISDARRFTRRLRATLALSGRHHRKQCEDPSGVYFHKHGHGLPHTEHTGYVDKSIIRTILMQPLTANTTTDIHACNATKSPTTNQPG